MPSDHFRSLARRPVSLPATLIASDGSWTEEVSIVDLGLGGAGLLLRRPLDAGVEVRLQMTAPDLWEPLIVSGSVRWAVADERGVNRAGILFHPESGRQVRALADLVASTAYD